MREPRAQSPRQASLPADERSVVRLIKAFVLMTLVMTAQRAGGRSVATKINLDAHHRRHADR
jgi:hypothetical protein